MKNEQNNGGPAFPMGYHRDGNSADHPGMTLREYAAIKLRVPNSGVGWLDDMIRESQRDAKPEPELSDPTNLKVGDLIQWSNEASPVQVVSVDGDRFTDSLGIVMAMSETGYTVVPAPEGSDK